MTKTMVFIDSRVNDLDFFISQFDAGTEYHVLDATRDGIFQIEELVTGKSDYSSIQIISHGSSGAITLGSKHLTNTNLFQYQSQLESIGHSLTENGDLLLYGCNVGAGDEGIRFVETLAAMTGADVAASDDLTGGANTGGDWELEVSSGVVDVQHDNTKYNDTYNSSLIVIPSDNPDDSKFKVSKGAFDGVVYIVYDENPDDDIINFASGSLLWDGKHIITAAHAVCEEGTVNIVPKDKLSINFLLLTSGAVDIKVKDIYINPAYSIKYDNGGYLEEIHNDIAIIELATEAPSAADKYDIYRDGNALNKLVTHVGYGKRGSGETGVNDHSPFGEAFYGYNNYDFKYEDANFTGIPIIDDKSLLYDFDNGTIEKNSFGGIGVGDHEVGIAPGDSGGPGFINSKIAGVHSWGVPITGVWGSVEGDTNVFFYASWIDDILATFYGTNRAETINGDGRDNYVYGEGGNDKLNGLDGNDTIYGGSGNDKISAGSGNDAVYAGSEDDTITGGLGTDFIGGEYGNDTAVFSGLFTDYNIYSYSKLYYTVIGPDGLDTLTGIENFQFDDITIKSKDACASIYGTAKVDYLTCNSLKNFVYGDGGNDVCRVKINVYRTNVVSQQSLGMKTFALSSAADLTASAPQGSDFIDGGDGLDTVIFNGNFAEYSISYDESTSALTFIDISGQDDPCIVTNVERFQFADATKTVGSIKAGIQSGNSAVDYVAVHPVNSSTQTFPGHTMGESRNQGAFAAMLEDGSVLTWGDSRFGGDSSLVAGKLNGTVNIVQVFSSAWGFAALRGDGSVVSWGMASDSSAVSSELDGTIDVVQVFSSSTSFAALREDGSVITWGYPTYGADSSAVEAQLDGTIDVVKVFSSAGAFAALRDDGSVITWGNSSYGGNSSAVAAQLDGSIDVVQVFSSVYAFAALRGDGSVITWGDSAYGGDSGAVAAQLDGSIDVVQVFSSGGAFAALRGDGSVITWGDSAYGGNSSAVSNKLDGTIDVEQVFSTRGAGIGAFAALREDGSVVTWGFEGVGGNSNVVAAKLDGSIDVVRISSTDFAFAALRADGSVVTWGGSTLGGNSSAVASKIDGTIDVVEIFSNYTAFAALRSDGSVVTWGESGRGGDSSAVASKLDGTIDVVKVFSNYAAFAAIRSDGSVVTWGESGSGGNSNTVIDKLTHVVDISNIYTNSTGDQDRTGTQDNDALSGNIGSDILWGYEGDDELAGMAGDDLVFGGDGNDMLIGGEGEGNDTYDGGAGDDTVKYNSALAGITVDLSEGAAFSTDSNDAAGIGEDTLIDIENIIAGNFDDLLIGNAGANSIEGGAGNDTLVGGEGADTLDGCAGSDMADYSDKSLSVMVVLNGSTDAIVFVGGIAEDTIRNIENVIGGSGNDSLTGDTADNSFRGGEGADTIDGGAGADTADYYDKIGDVSVTLKGAVEDTVMVGGVAEDTIRNIENVIGGVGNDSLTGDSADNNFRGGEGADTLEGGAGSDTADYSDKLESVAATLQGSSDTTVTVGGVAEDTIHNIENVIGGAGNDSLTGDGADNNFKGGEGADTFEGGAGSDTADYSDKTADVSVTLKGAVDAIVMVVGVAEDIIRNIENVIGGAGNDSLTGDEAGNTLFGLSGDDILRGGSGNDMLDGGLGFDTADYSDKTATVSITLNGSVDSSVMLGGIAEDTIRNIENLIGGSGNDSLTGDAAYNTLSGLTGDDILRGGSGNDTFDGGIGFDTADYSDKTADVSVTLNGAVDALVKVGGVAEDTILNIENVIGGAENDSLTGDGANNSFRGGAGADTLDGVLGSDTADYSDKIADVSVTLKGAVDAIVMVGGVAEDTIRNIENVIGGAGNDSLTGDAADNNFRGGSGTDTLDGGFGFDTADYSDKLESVAATLQGSSDTTVKVGGVAEDTIRNIENVIGGAGNDSLMGDGADNNFRGGSGADTLDGGLGFDTADYSDKMGAVSVILNGSVDAIVTVGGVAEDTIHNIENVIGGAGNDALTGDAAGNTLFGLSDDDILCGGYGNDTLDGGTGSDTADYSDKIADVAVTLSGAVDVMVMVGGVAEDTIRNIENVIGGAGNDVLTGDAAGNTLFGLSDDDILCGGYGNDTLDGGTGSDSADYSDKIADVAVTLNGAVDAIVMVGGIAEDTIRNIENVIGGAGNDVLTGDASGNALSGSDGDDTLQGAAGNDRLDGGFDVDTAVFSGNLTEYALSYDFAAQSYTIIDSFDGRDGTDTLTNIEYFQFADGTHAVDDLLDITLPYIESMTPDETTFSVAPATNIVLKFSESIQRGTGTIVIYSGSADGTVVESFDVATSSCLSFADKTLTIDPSADLASETHYVVTLEEGTVKDLAGNSYPGTTSCNFTTSAAGTNVSPIISLPFVISFAAHVDYATGLQPYSVTSTDVNGDGQADLIVANNLSSTVSVLMNNGEGTFAPKVDYSTGSAPISLISADLNGDGHADLVVANNFSDTVSVLINNGEGTFAAKVDYDAGSGTCFVITADVSGDGQLDLIIANWNSNSISVLTNNGHGTFTAKVDYATGWNPRSVTNADVNGDGKSDLIVGNWSDNSVTVLTNSGDGTFARVDYATGTNPHFVTSADVNGDGKADLITANFFNDSVTVLTNSGDGTFARADYTTGWNPDSVVCADVNGDDKIDLIVANESSNSISVLQNNGDGTFATKVDYVTGNFPYSVTTLDINCDGKSDLIVANANSNTISVLTNTSVPTVTSFTEQTPITVSSGIIINDPDGDAAWSGGSLKVQITANADASDTLNLATVNPGGSGIWLDTNGNKLMAGSSEIGIADATSVAAGNAWSFTFNATATNALVQEVARSVNFFNSSDAPGTADRLISFTAIDNFGASASIVQTVIFTTVPNAADTLSDNVLTFDLGIQSPVLASTGQVTVKVANPSDNLTSVTLDVSSLALVGSYLTVPVNGTDANGVSYSLNAYGGTKLLVEIPAGLIVGEDAQAHAWQVGGMSGTSYLLTSMTVVADGAGTNESDWVTGSFGDESINAGGGDDFIEFRGGSDTVDAGEGYDTLSLSLSGDSIYSRADEQGVFHIGLLPSVDAYHITKQADALFRIDKMQADGATVESTMLISNTEQVIVMAGYSGVKLKADNNGTPWGDQISLNVANLENLTSVFGDSGWDTLALDVGTGYSKLEVIKNGASYVLRGTAASDESVVDLGQLDFAQYSATMTVGTGISAKSINLYSIEAFHFVSDSVTLDFMPDSLLNNVLSIVLDVPSPVLASSGQVSVNVADWSGQLSSVTLDVTSLSLDGSCLMVPMSGIDADGSPYTLTFSNDSKILLTLPAGILGQTDSWAHAWHVTYWGDGTYTLQQMGVVTDGSGTSDSDWVIGTTGNDSIDAGLGDDLLLWSGGNDTVDAGEGSDILNLPLSGSITSQLDAAGVLHITAISNTSALMLMPAVDAYQITRQTDASFRIDKMQADGATVESTMLLSNAEQIAAGYYSFKLFPDTFVSGRNYLSGTPWDDQIDLNVANLGSLMYVWGDSGRDTLVLDFGTGYSKLELVRNGSAYLLKGTVDASGTVVDLGMAEFSPNDTTITIGVVSEAKPFSLNSIEAFHFISGTTFYDVDLSQFAEVSFQIGSWANGITGTAKDDTIDADALGLAYQATTTNDYIRGNEGDDSINAGAGNDNVYGNGGNDTIDGGAGNDTASYNGNKSDYIITNSNGLWSVVDNRIGSPDGTDTLTGIEYLSFYDAGLNLTVQFTPTSYDWSSNTITGSSFDDQIDADTLAVANPYSGCEWVYINLAYQPVYTLGANEFSDIGTVTFTAPELIILANSGFELWHGTEKVQSSFTVSATDISSQTGGAYTLHWVGTATQTEVPYSLGFSYDKEGVYSHNDNINGNGGNDTIDGGPGNDTASYNGNKSDYTITNSNGVWSVVDNRIGSPDGTDTLTGIEHLSFSDAGLNLTVQFTPTSYDWLSNTITGSSFDDQIDADALAVANPYTGSEWVYVNLAYQPVYTLGANEFSEKGMVTFTIQELTNLTNFGFELWHGTEKVQTSFTVSAADISNQTGGAYTMHWVGTATQSEVPNSLRFSYDKEGAYCHNDNIYGNEGDDTIDGGAGNDAIDGGDGNDTVVFSGNFADYSITLDKNSLIFTVTDMVPGRDGTDQLTHIESFKFTDGLLQAYDACTVVNGNYRTEYLYGNDQDNHLFGGGGDDVLEGKKGNDTIDGGIGTDAVIFTGNYADYIITQNADQTSFAITDQIGGRDGTDLVSRVEQYRFADGVREVVHLVDGGGSGTGTGGITVSANRVSSSTMMFPGHTMGEWTNQNAFAALRADGSVVTWGAGLYGGDSSAVVDELNGNVDVVHVFSAGWSFAALRSDGSVVSWGDSLYGGNSSAVANQINGNVDVMKVFSSTGSFAALRSDGSVVTWGDSLYGGNSSAVASKLNGDVDVVQVFSAEYAFAALRSDGSVVTWGNSAWGGDSSAVANQISGNVDVVQVFSAGGSFAALREDGSVVTWGHSVFGGDSSAVANQINGNVDVVQVFSTAQAFAALRADGSVVTWGYSSSGGDSSGVVSKLNGDVDVVQVFSTGNAFAALRADGSVVTWGDSLYGGNSSAVASKLNGDVDVVQVFSAYGSFAALREDGSVVTWGEIYDGGDSNAVASELNGDVDVVQVYSAGWSSAALREDGSVVTWNNIMWGGDSSAVANQINGNVDVVKVFSTTADSYAALREDGSVVTWGYNISGGDSSAVEDKLHDVVSISDIYSSSSQERIFSGSDGNDNLSGSYLSDILWGNGGNDMLAAMGGNDLAFGGLGNDLFIGGEGEGDDTYVGGEGVDTVKYTSALDGITVDLAEGMAYSTDGNDAAAIGTDVLIDIENVIGGNLNDILIGNAFANSLEGGDGDDTLDGGDGSDTSDYSDKIADVSVTLNGAFDAMVMVGGVAEDTIRNIENVIGGAGNDVLTGDAAGNTLSGSDGDDTLQGAAGNDKLDGGIDADTAVFSGNLAEYALSYDFAAQSYTVIDSVNGRDGTDALNNIEYFHFSDGLHSVADLIDIIPPDLQAADPVGHATGVAVGTNIVLTFNEPVQAGTGSILLQTGGVTVMTIDVTDTTQVSFNGSTLTVNPTSNLSNGTHYFVTFAEGSVEDLTGNHFTGSDTYDFTTAAATSSLFDLIGSVHFWKSGAAIAGVTSTLASVPAAAGTQLVEFRNIQITADGTRTIEIWETSTRTDIGSVQLEFVLPTGSVATWVDASGLPSGWSSMPNTGISGQFILGGMGITALSAGPVKLGTLTLTAPTNPQHFELALTTGQLGTDLVPAFGIASDSMTTALDGLYQHLDMADGSYALTSAKVSGTAESTAIKANDALAALKIAVGMNPNADGSAVSPYQYLAADVNHDGQVKAADALNILKMAVKLDTAPAKEWLFVPESVGSESMTRTHVVWPDNPIPVTLDMDQELNLIGIVKGDVNGSWVA